MNIPSNNEVEDTNDYKINQDKPKKNKNKRDGNSYTYKQEFDVKDNNLNIITNNIGSSSNCNKFNINKNTNVNNTITKIQSSEDNHLINNNDNNFIVNKSNSVLSLFNEEDNKECKVAEWAYLGGSFTIDKQVYTPTTSLAFIATESSYIYRVRDPKGTIKILKIACPDKEHINAKSILNERRILKEVHEGKNAKGICPYPQLLFFKNTQEVAYLQEEYDCNLANPDLLTTQNQIKGALDLFDGLYYLHSKGIVHGDIKPNNCGSKGGNFYLSDFGTARKIEEDASFLNDPFGGWYTRPYLSNCDIAEGKKIYLLNLIAKIAQKKLDNTPLDLDDAKHLENYITTIDPKGTYIFHHKAVKGKYIIQGIRLEIADILKNQNLEKIKEYQFLNYNKEISKIKNNGNSLAKLQPNISLYDYHGTKTEQDSRHWELVNVCKKRDIYALGKTLIFLFAPDLGKKDNEISDKQILNYLQKNKKLLFDNLSLKKKDRLIKLLTNMISDKLNDRPLIEVARNEYKNIMGL